MILNFKNSSFMPCKHRIIHKSFKEPIDIDARYQVLETIAKVVKL
jgi:hypothetical protein